MYDAFKEMVATVTDRMRTPSPAEEQPAPAPDAGDGCVVYYVDFRLKTLIKKEVVE